MNDSKFSRELKDLIYFIREYGVQHLSYKLETPDKLFDDSEKSSEFFTKVHKGFFAAQERVIFLLEKILNEQKQRKAALAEARRQRQKVQSEEIVHALRKAQYQERVLRKVMDSIAWQIFNYDLSTLRRFYCGYEPIDITNSNLQSEISFVEHFMQNNHDGFVLINDLTSFLQIGDVVTMSLNTGIGIVELKEGKENDRVFELVDDVAKAKCTRYLQLRLQNEDENFVKQFRRNVKQIIKSNEVSEILTTGYGTDQLTGQKVRILQDEIQLDTFTEIICSLSKECNKKGYAISVIEECLLIGVYDIEKFPCEAFELWARGLKIDTPIYDMRSSFYDPLCYPIFLQPFSDTFIVDLILGKKVIKMTIDINKWLNPLKDEGFNVRRLSKKETGRINSKMKGSNKIFDIKGQGIEIEKNGIKIEVGQGIFSRMFTAFNTPSSMKKVFRASVEQTYKADLEK